MTHLVVDASVVITWFRPHAEPYAHAARRIWRRYADDEAMLAAPTILPLELLNTLGRRWGWSANDVRDVALTFGQLQIDLLEPDVAGVAGWTAAGLTAYDAA